MRPLASFSPVIRPGKPGLLFIPLLMAQLLATACGGRVYLATSLILPHAIVVDGDAEEWSGALSYVAKDHLFVGFVNDRDNLFICLSKEDEGGSGPARMGGWTVWFDPAGGTRKVFGLRIGPTGGPAEGEARDERGEHAQEGRTPSLEGTGEIQWIGPRGDVLRQLSRGAAAELGLEVAESRSGGSDVLEIKMPLKVTEEHPLGIGAGPDDAVGVGFFSYRPEDRNRRGGRPGGGEGGGMTGGLGGDRMGGPGGGWRGGLPPNMNPDISKDVKVWPRVRLFRSDKPGRSMVLDLILE